MTRRFVNLRIDTEFDEYIRSLNEIRNLGNYSEAVRNIIHEHKEKIGLGQ